MTTLKPTVCQICGCNCGLLVTLDKGRVTHVQGDPDVPQNRGGICIKGKMSPRVLYAPDRLKEPMIRRRYGTGFVSASWSDALSEIAARLEKTKEKYGPEALAIYRGRSTRFIDRVFISAFAALFGTPNATGVWTLCVGPKLIGFQSTFGTPLFPRCDFRSAKLILLWGTNPGVTRMHRYFSLPSDIRAAVRNGAELVVVDPRCHRFAKEATLHLPITPGTDSYLILALIKILIDRNWVDRDYIRAHVAGFEKLCEVVKTVELRSSSEKTGISLAVIHELAEKLAKQKPASIDRREGVIHQVNGTQINRALSILTAITGNADIPGGLRFPELARFSDADEILRQVFADSGRPDLDPVDMRHGMRLEPTAFGKLRGNGFNTPSGKIELYSHQLAAQGYAPLPEAEDGCKCGARYPYRLVTGSRVDAFNHSQHRNIPCSILKC